MGHRRILIAGGPRTGKTTFANRIASKLRVAPRHTDDLIGLYQWSAASDEVARWFDDPGPFVIEGVAVARALRKWLAFHHAGKPADVVYLGSVPHVALSIGQASMASGCETVWNEIRDEVVYRGVEVRDIPSDTGSIAEPKAASLEDHFRFRQMAPRARF